MVILLVAISSYYIGGYLRLNYHKLLMAIGGYWWLLMDIILLPIGGYFINGY